ncbi:MAG: UDP-N-acetylmuramate dehydrogenase [Oscillospiraceae bacterium]|jgi:UDP-N-acetylmuramate dehydrogenase|nr:UDP-N-acetylmuramate dehydrogenase [Oscillospiraceae bacterium]
MTLAQCRALCAAVTENEPMSARTTLKIGGPAELFALPCREEEMTALLRAAPDAAVIGNGSNLLVGDRGIRGLVICTAALRQITREGDCLVLAAGAPLPRAANFALECGLAGLEFCGGIPGTAGGALCMNAGAYDGEMADVVVSSRYAEGGQTRAETDHAFAYRRSVYTDNPRRAVLSVTLRLAEGDKAAIGAKMESIAAKRRERQPLDRPSAGSAFRRPGSRAAAELIESCGLKGAAVGGAQVSEKHAGFIINRGGATCEDVKRLLALVGETVLRETGVALEPEIKMMGE